MFQDIYFDFPQAAYLLFLLVPLLFLAYLQFKYRQRKIAIYTPPQHLSQLVYPRSNFFSSIRIICFSLSLALAILSLMNPKGNLQYFTPQLPQASNQLKRKAQEVIFLIDTSASMSVSDARHQQTRLENAKEIADEVIGQLNGPTVSVYAFTSQLTSIVPSTSDYLFTRLMIKNLQINEGEVEGTNFKNALLALRDKIVSSPTSQIYTWIILSDGGDNQIEHLQGAARQQAIQEVSRFFSSLQQLDIKIFAVGIGSAEGGIVPNVTEEGKPVKSKLEGDILDQIAKLGNGEYILANSINSWSLSQRLVQHIEQEAQYEEQTTDRVVAPPQQEERIYDLYYQYPLGLSILCLLTALLLPQVESRRKVLIILLAICPLSLFSQEPIKEKGRRAAALFAAHDYEQAAAIYANLSQESLPSWQHALVLYNLGTARLAQNRPRDTLQAFHAIPLTAISNPLLLINLAVNQGLAYLIEGSIGNELSLQYAGRSFKEASHMACQLAQVEGSSCYPLENIENLFSYALFQLRQTRQKQRQSSLDKHPEVLAAALVESLTHLLDLMAASPQKPYTDYLFQSAKSLRAFIMKKMESPYDQFLHSLENHEFKASQDLLEEIIRLLKEEASLSGPLILSLLVLINQENLDAEQIRKFEKKTDSPVASYIHLSLIQLQEGREMAARFFLLQGFFALQNSSYDQDNPQAILSHALEMAKQGLQLNQLLQLSEKGSPLDEMNQMLQDSHKQLLQVAQSFVSKAVDLQKEQFKQSCQDRPWNLVLPLFEKGFRSALTAKQDLPNALSSQEETIRNWEQALQLMSLDYQSQEVKEPSSTDIREVFRSLQEMQAEDQIERPAPSQELHSW